jgi:hypothetical protein
MPRHTRLSLLPLEDRATPAFATYAAGVLTVTAKPSDVIAVVPKLFANNNTVPGYLEVQANAVAVFDSAANQHVTGLVVRPETAGHYSLDVGDGVVVTNLNVLAALPLTDITVHGGAKVTGNLTVTGTDGDDHLTLEAGVFVGGNLTANLKNGANVLQLQGGTIGGSLSVTTGAGNDDVAVGKAGDVVVGGGVKFALGNGDNALHAPAQRTFEVGKSFAYTGGTGNDDISFFTFNAELIVGGNVTVAFGGAGNVQNDWVTHSLHVGGSMSFTGGAGQDAVSFYGHSTVGGGVTFTTGGGPNSLNLGGSDYHTVIGGGLKYTGGAGIDQVRLDDLAIGRDAILNLGAGATQQKVYLGTQQGAPLTIGGNLTITTGEAGDDIRVLQTTVGKALTITAGGGADTVYIDDTDVAGLTLIDLGAGADQLYVDTLADNGNGDPLPGVTQFGGSLTILAGDGDDTVNLSKFFGDRVVVGGAFKLVGGTGQDTFKNYVNNLYVGTKFEDCEAGDNF